MSDFCVDLASAADVRGSVTVGGKASGLAFLREHGFPTLPALAVTAEAFDRPGAPSSAEQEERRDQRHA